VTMTPSSLALMRGAEPLFFDADSATGVICLHGLTATPHEVRWLGEHLHSAGFTVMAPRLAGHGTHYSALERITWQDWVQSALDAYHMLRGRCDKVMVAGLSMGSLVTLMLGATVDVAALAVMASPLQMQSRLLPYAAQIKHLKSKWDFRDETDFPRRLREEQLSRGEPNLGRVRYEICPTNALAALYALSETARESLPKIMAPTTLIYSKGDQSVSYDNLAIAQAGLTNAHVEAHTLEKSGHILTQDMEKDMVFQIVTDFFNAQA
jgi:carboxylesterase